MSKSLALRRAHRRPKPAALPDPTEAQIARIDALTATGRTNWFALLAYLAFVLVTTLGVEDVDFFVDTRPTDLPLVGVAIPTFSFFVFAPILGAALYIFLHLHIRKVSEALAEPPPGPPPLEERIKPWLLNDTILRQRRDGAIRPRPLDRLASLTTLLLVWWAGPIVLGIMWWRTWPAHALWLSALCAASLMAAVYAGSLSWAKMRSDIHRRRSTPVLSTTIILLLLCLPMHGLPPPTARASGNSLETFRWSVVVAVWRTSASWHRKSKSGCCSNVWRGTFRRSIHRTLLGRDCRSCRRRTSSHTRPAPLPAQLLPPARHPG